MIIGFVRKFVGILYQKHDYYLYLLCYAIALSWEHLHESVGDGREEGGGPGGGPQVVEAGVVLEAEHGRAEAHGDQEELQGRVHLRADV